MLRSLARVYHIPRGIEAALSIGIDPLNDPGHSDPKGAVVETIPGGAGFDFRAVYQLFLRRRAVILATAAVVFAAIALYTLRQPRIYSATASVVIDATAPRFLDSQVQDPSEAGGAGYWYTREYTETQTRIIASRAVAARVVEKLNLQSDSGFLGLAGVTDSRAREAAMKAADAVAILQGKLKVVPVKDTRIVDVRVEDVDPKRAAVLANEVADAYLAENLDMRLRTSESANRWLEERLTELEQKTKRSELAVYEFKKDADILSTSLEDRANIVSQQLTTYSQALTDVRTRIAGLKARVDAIESVRRGADAAKEQEWADVLTVTGTPAVAQALKARYVQEKLECAGLAERYLPGHPKLASCLERVESAKRDFLKELSNVVGAARVELAEAIAKERNLQALVDGAKGEAFEVNKRQIEFDRIKREADSNQRLYDLVLKRLKDTELSGMLRTNNVRILDAARPSFAPLRPRVGNNLIFGLLVGLAAGLGLAFLLDHLDNTVKTQTDVEERVGVPFLGFFPRVNETTDPEHLEERDLYVFRNPKSSVAEACRAIRTNLLFMSPDRPLRTMLVTSSGPREGKSACVIATGVAMAQSGSRVVLVDTDMRRPRLHRAMRVPNDHGVSSVLVGDATLDEVIKSTEVPGLFVIPSGPIPPNPAELLHTKAFHEFLASLSSRFDRVIFDSPPVNAVADPAVLATQVDGTLLVVRAGRTNRSYARTAARVLSDVNGRVFGAVLNDVDLGSSKYGGYYAVYQGYSAEYHEQKSA